MSDILKIQYIDHSTLNCESVSSPYFFTIDSALSFSADITFRVSQGSIPAPIFYSLRTLHSATSWISDKRHRSKSPCTEHGNPTVVTFWSEPKFVTSLCFPSAVCMSVAKVLTVPPCGNVPSIYWWSFYFIFMHCLVIFGWFHEFTDHYPGKAHSCPGLRCIFCLSEHCIKASSISFQDSPQSSLKRRSDNSV